MDKVASIRIEKKCDLSVFKHAVDARWLGLGISETDDLQGFSWFYRK